MKYQVTIPDWQVGVPLHIYIEADSPEQALDNGLNKLRTVFTAYGLEMPDFSEIASVKEGK